MTRIAVLNEDKCKVKKCNSLCVSFCPMVRSRVEAIRVEGDKAIIAETLCSGCGICVKKCPFKAISIVNLPDELEKDCSHRFGENSFKLFRLPMPSPGTVLGLLGQNGIGKSTTLKVFSGEIKPNLGRFDDPARLARNYPVLSGFKPSRLLPKTKRKKTQSQQQTPIRRQNSQSGFRQSWRALGKS